MREKIETGKNDATLQTLSKKIYFNDSEKQPSSICVHLYMSKETVATFEGMIFRSS